MHWGTSKARNLESLQGVLDAAEATQSPVIIGFNGEFLSRPNRKLPERLQCYAELGRAAATCATVPCGLIFNECPDDRWVRDAVLAGFNLVMPANPKVIVGLIIPGRSFRSAQQFGQQSPVQRSSQRHPHRFEFFRS